MRAHGQWRPEAAAQAAATSHRACRDRALERLAATAVPSVALVKRDPERARATTETAAERSRACEAARRARAARAAGESRPDAVDALAGGYTEADYQRDPRARLLHDLHAQGLTSGPAAAEAVSAVLRIPSIRSTRIDALSSAQIERHEATGSLVPVGFPSVPGR